MDKKRIKKSYKTRRQIVIDDVIKFVRDNYIELENHYYSVIDKNSKHGKRALDTKIYQEISEEEYNRELLKVSVVILTANFFECEILNNNAYKDFSNKKIKKLKDGITLFPNCNFKVVNAYIMQIDNLTVLHLHAPETGSNTPCGSTDLARYVFNNKFLQSSCIISFGICYGINPEDNSLGETLIAKKIYPCSIGLKIKEKDWSIKHDDFIIDLRQCNPSMYSKIEDIANGLQNKSGYNDYFKAIPCNMLTGEAVVSNEKTKIESVEKAFGCEIVGGEMEGYGLAKECIYYYNATCLIIKAICDWGACKDIDKEINKANKKNDNSEDDKKDKNKTDYKGQIQAYTAYCAYTVLKKLFLEKIFEVGSIYYQVIEHLFSTCYPIKVVQHEELVNHISKFLKKQIYKDKNIYKKDLQQVTQLLICNMIDDKTLEIVIDNNIRGYKFT